MDQPSSAPFLSDEDKAEVDRTRAYLERGEIPPGSRALTWDDSIPGDRERARDEFLKEVYREFGGGRSAA